MAPPRRRRTSSSEMQLARPRPKFLVEREAETDSEGHSESDQPRRRWDNKPPPSSFAFPFQAYAGNPDPGLPIPGRRRSSLESIIVQSRPIAPFIDSASLPRSSSSNSLYKQSVAANITTMPSDQAIPRNASIHSFRAPFLAPHSRPSSSLWSPPSHPTNLILASSPSASSTALVLPILKSKPPLPSTRLSAPLQQTDKPWLTQPEPNARSSYLLTLLCIFLGFMAAAALAFFGLRSVPLLDEKHLCMVLDESFSGSSLDEGVWNYDVQLGGFGNGEFQMTTKDADNIFLSNGNLYIYPTLTSDKVQNVMDGGNYTLDDCTVMQTNATACSASSSAALGTVINPIMSGRINTKAKKSIRFGKVEVRAKLPQGYVFSFLGFNLILSSAEIGYGPPYGSSPKTTLMVPGPLLVKSTFSKHEATPPLILLKVPILSARRYTMGPFPLSNTPFMDGGTPREKPTALQGGSTPTLSNGTKPF